MELQLKSCDQESLQHLAQTLIGDLEKSIPEILDAAVFWWDRFHIVFDLFGPTGPARDSLVRKSKSDANQAAQFTTG